MKTLKTGNQRFAVLRMFLALGLSLALPMTILAQSTAPSTRPAAAQNPTVAELEKLSVKVRFIHDLSTRFRQEKHTAILRKPLVSSGTVRIVGSTMRWDTQKPADSVLLIAKDDVRIYYPAQSLLEVYQLDQQMMRMAASPIPQLDVLREHFDIEGIKAAELAKDATDAKYLGVVLLPKDASLKEHLDRVRLLIDRETAYLSQMEMIDADGDRTVVHFEAMKVNTGISEYDLKLNLPAGTQISYPMGQDEEK